jgi:predicted GIY-YIG superfamily endonuclease
VEDRPALSTWSECTVTVPIRTESGLLAEWRQPSPETAVYRIYNAADELLYVGITNDLYVRWTDHKATKPWWREEAHRYDVLWYASREEAAAEERRAIIAERPRHNKLCLLPSQRPVGPGRPNVYSVKQIAQRFRRSPQTVRVLAARPDFPRSVNGRSVSDRGGPRYSIEEIEAYFAANP